MEWKPLLHGTFEYQYGVAEKLMNLAENEKLDWKPETGSNWMTLGQLLRHISDACGMPCKGFATGDWGMPEGMDMENMSPEDMLPPAEKLPAVSSVQEAKDLLAADKKLAFEILNEVSEDRLENEIAKAPWDPMEFRLGQRFAQMAEHLSVHKAQLFYYLKLMGKPVNTGHLW